MFRKLKRAPCTCRRCVVDRTRTKKLPGCPHCRFVWERTVKAEAACCGWGERHTHCDICGAMVSVGDWGAKPIASFEIRL